jgi:hypothetical protein
MERGANRAPPTRDELSEGLTVSREPAYAAKCSQDGETQAASE